MHRFTVLFTGIFVPASILIPIGIAIYQYRYTNKALRAILLYLIVSGLTNVIGAWLAFHHQNNLPLLHLDSVLELLLLMRFYRQAIPGPAIRRCVTITMLAFPVIAVVNLLFFQSVYRFNSYTRSIEAIILIVFGLIYVYRRTDIYADAANRGAAGKPSPSANPSRPAGNAPSPTTTAIRPETWIVSGILIYFSSSFFQFTFPNIVSRTASLFIRLLIWDIHAGFVMIMYLFFAVGFYHAKTDR